MGRTASLAAAAAGGAALCALAHHRRQACRGADGAAHRSGGARAPRDRDSTALSYDLEVDVDADPAAVYAVLADVQNHVATAAGVRMRKIPAGPTKVGTRWHEEVRLAPGVWMPVTSAVTAAAPPGLLEEDFASPFFSGHLRYDVAPTAAGSTLRQRQVVQPHRPLRWLRRAMDAALRPRLLDRLANIRDLVEGARGRSHVSGHSTPPGLTEEHDGPRRRYP